MNYWYKKIIIWALILNIWRLNFYKLFFIYIIKFSHVYKVRVSIYVSYQILDATKHYLEILCLIWAPLVQSMLLLLETSLENILNKGIEFTEAVLRKTIISTKRHCKRHFLQVVCFCPTFTVPFTMIHPNNLFLSLPSKLYAIYWFGFYILSLFFTPHFNFIPPLSTLTICFKNI